VACGGRAAADADRDGIPDALEQSLAQSLFPALHLSTLETCPQPDNPKPVLFRARHPTAAGMRDDTVIVINYVVLYDADCGDGPHPGDNEPLVVFARRSAGSGGRIDDSYVFESLAATAHTHTGIEQRTSSRGRDIWIQPNKHANFADFSVCPACDRNGAGVRAAFFNVGERAAPLIADLGEVGVAYRGVNPWGPARFLGAGAIGDEDLSLRYFTYLTHPPRAADGRWDED
jgi:hypothetical protein